jgi:hypothetical protein
MDKANKVMCRVYHSILAIQTELLARPVGSVHISDSCIVTGCYASYVKYEELARAGEGSDGVASRSHSDNFILNGAEHKLDQLLDMEITWLVFLIVSAVALGIVLLMLIFLRKRIQVAVALIQEASK